MTPLKILSAIVLFYSSVSIHAQEVQKATLTYTPPENGYILEIPFAWKFINCFGEVHVTITNNSKDITSSVYLYNGVRYTAAELGNEAFAKPECGLISVSADVYHQAYHLGKIEMYNVIDWLGGCFGQTYHVTKLLGVADVDYKDKITELSLSSLSIKECSSRDATLEGRIKEIEKQRQLTGKISEADRAFASGNLEEAKRLYEEAGKIEYTNEHVKSRLQEIKQQQVSKEKEQEYKKMMEEGKRLEQKGDFEGAKAAYEKAKKVRPNDAAAQDRINAINEQLTEERKAQTTRNEAVSAASNRNHSGSFWGHNLGSDSHGTSTQAANLIGNFRLDYQIWTLSGEPAHKFRFYWEWDNALYTGYPQWVSVLSDTVVMIEELKKYPDLMARWNRIKPLYIEIECDINYYKNGDNFVADEGTIKIIPEVIGTSGQEVDWSLPSSSNWDELFTYCNGLEWGFFRKMGLYEEIDEYADKFSTGIAWAKYAFEHSDQINFFQGYSFFHSEFKQLTSADYDNYSSTADIVKVVWPEKVIQDLIREFEEREKQARDESLSVDDFWNTPENEKKAETADFWDTPENDLTVSELKQQQESVENDRLLAAWPAIIERQREKYRALQNPFTIKSPANNSSFDKNVVTVDGSINQYFQKYSNEVYLNLNGVRQQVDVDRSGNFSNPMVLSNGLNEIMLELQGNGFTIMKSLRVSYEGVDTDIRVTLTWNTSGSDIDLYIEDPSGRTCNYSNKSAGSMSLDVDDTNGYGPENISVVDGDYGPYEIRVQNYGSGTGTEATVYIYVREQLQDVVKHTFSRSKEFWTVGTVQLR